ncbi:RluA family pseudouridine synthase [Agrilactobacillus fermenti]|uniref:RluA family pseudouridine synthase n=1 Tax=Agrilactobacillus fermenti TaxID=2586909 RepID=UPI001E48DBDD|nr:RluA family pseudouridine synthase [Agrilactobacillus fermenti]
MKRNIYLNTQTTFPSVRALLKAWYIPRKWQHELRVNKAVLINGQYQNFNLAVKPDSQVTLNFKNISSNQQNYPAAFRHDLAIFYEDRDLIVINKPAGLKTHPNQPNETNTLINYVAGYLAPKRQQPYILHRLDMLTSGLIIFAKNPLVVPLMNAMLRDKVIQRHYLAIVRNSFTLKDQGMIDLPIDFDPKDQRKRRVASTGLPAITNYKTLKRQQGLALVQLTLATGRTHQIRVHLNALNAPIVNDPLYDALTPENTTDRLMLFAQEINLQRPFSYNKIVIQAPIPRAFKTYF